MRRRLLLIDARGKKHLVEEGRDLHTSSGVVKGELINAANVGKRVESHIGHTFCLLEPRLVDFLEKARRGPQAITPKDCAAIAAYTSIGPGCRVVDAGTGSGLLAMFLANLVRPEKLITYEIREDFARIAQENFRRAGVENVELKLKNIYEGIDEEELDLITLDLPEPWRVLEEAQRKLKVGGWVVAYTPSIEQAKKFWDKASAMGCWSLRTVEVLERGWRMDVLRPESRLLGHTGFLNFARLLYRR